MKSRGARRVLVVDDNPEARLLIRVTLEQAGHTVIGEADNGATAISDAFQLQPEVITIDYQMPYLTGEKSLEHIREVVPDAKVVVVSATLEEPPDWAEVFVPKTMIAQLPSILDSLFEDGSPVESS